MRVAHTPRHIVVFLMLGMFAGVVLALGAAIRVAGGTPAAVWPLVGAVLVFMLLSVCAAAAVVLGILRTLRRSGVHRLENVQVEPNGKLLGKF